jgi:H+-transporting ATPase
MEISIEDAKKTSIDDLYDLISSSQSGLTSQEAISRLQKYGPNEIPEKKQSPILKFLGNFWGPIPWMIEIAAVLSIIIQHWDDFGVIITMLLINAIVRFWEEYKADNAIELLKQKLALKAKVLRDNIWIEGLARDLVPGDIVRIRLGDIIPADIKLIEGNYISVDESVLTGESLPVEKQISDIAYEGAIIRQGEMNGLVVGTGTNTFFGRTTMLVSAAKTKSHFQKAIVKIGNYLIILAVSLVVLVLVIELLRNENFFLIFQFTLVLIVAAIPVALPAVLMVSMAVGAADLAKKEAIAKRLLSIEEVASMDTLCSDKTGTITKNEISIAEILPLENFNEIDVLLYGILASREEDKDPIDNAFFISFREKKSKNEKDFFSNYKLISYEPFDPIIKRTEALIAVDSTQFKVTKGAIQIILKLVANKDQIASKIESVGNEFARQGYRSLGVAKTDDNGTWKFVGVVGLFDPPREDSAETIKKAIDMGINVKLITGDHNAIAKQVAHNLGMGTNIVNASDIIGKEDNLTRELVETADGFAEVFPEHKFHIVELLQNKDHVVGMTGDGVNDAPALKKADVGIAVSNATDAAKSAADIVLTKPGLSVIIDATIESRIIFERMRSYAVYRIAETVRVLIFLVLAIIIFNVYPITALMIVMLALLNDLPIMTIAFDNERPAYRPVRWKMQKVIIIATLLGLIGVIFSFSLYLIGRDIFLIPTKPLQTFVFLKLAVAGHMTIYLTRSEDDHFWRRPFPAKILFFTCELTQLVATIFVAIGFLMAPLLWGFIGFIWLFALFEFIVADSLKVIVARKLK